MDDVTTQESTACVSSSSIQRRSGPGSGPSSSSHVQMQRKYAPSHAHVHVHDCALLLTSASASANSTSFLGRGGQFGGLLVFCRGIRELDHPSVRLAGPFAVDGPDGVPVP